MMNASKGIVWMVLAVMTLGRSLGETAVPVNFSREIRGLLSDACFNCHGPDEGTRKAGLRLDTKEGAISSKNGVHIVLPGDAENSELYRRLVAHDPLDRMPPMDSGKTVSQAQIQLVKDWINQGASWESHWAFEKPKRPELPEVKTKDWPRNEIDHFILARLEKEGLSPSEEADPRVLARRATLDLTGLPPTIEEVEAYLADESPEAHNRLVDRLLASSRYGEQMTRYWLDSARYADSHGYHIDAPRMIWKYREWVIDAFNRNLPYDQFTIEQIAGDMLPEATLEQKVASGFNRCNMSTGEGGAIEEEYRVKYAADRVETVGTVWLGLTVACAQCHTHKYDPITQTEFYQMAAIFNNIAEAALDGNRPAPDPFVQVPSPEQERELARLDKMIGELVAKVDGPNETLDAGQREWEAEWRGKMKSEYVTIEAEEIKSEGGATFKRLEDGSVLAEGENAAREVYELTFDLGEREIGALRLEALTDDSLPHKSSARSENGNWVLTGFEAEVWPSGDAERREKVEFAASIADHSQGGYPVRAALDGKSNTGWGSEGHVKRENRTALFIPERPVALAEGSKLRVRLRFESEFARHSIGRFRLSAAAPSEGQRLLTPPRLNDWHAAGPFAAASGDEAYQTDFGPEKKVDLEETFKDGTIKWERKSDFADGKANNLTGENSATYLYRVIRAPYEQEVTLSFGSDDAIKAWLNGEVVLDKNVQRGIAPDQDKVKVGLKQGDNTLLLKVVNYTGGYAFYFNLERDGGLPAEIAEFLALAGDELNEAQQTQLRRHYRENFSADYKEFQARLQAVRDERKKVSDAVPVTMVSRELDEPRETYLLIRGEYDKRGERVTPGVPAVLPPLPAAEVTNRLVFAKWLVDRENPLTARVTVNRFWQRYFGTGLVKTSEDFGAQGEPPSHPELLDWLAVEFMESGWDLKHIQRLIVTSATYRQSSRVTPELLQKDPENRLLARAPRYRMDAEMVRDNALAVGGLLVEKVGGPSVKPYQPPGLWTEVSYGFMEDYIEDTGEGLYRRSMYTYWKRQSPPPGMTTLDAPSREVCTVRRPRTNTPLQALMLLNDPQYVEASRGLARRMMTEGDCQEPASRIAFGYELATARVPTKEHLDVLLQVYQEQLEAYRADPEAALKLLGVGKSPRDESLDPNEYAAWTTVASMILNLDATITKS